MPTPGYRFGLRQPAHKATFIVSFPNQAVDWAALDAWLDQTLEAGIATPATPAPAEGEAHRQAFQLGSRMLQVAAALLRAGRVPAFAAGEVERATENPAKPGEWQLHVAIPFFEYLPLALIERAYDAAATLVTVAARKTSAFHDLEKLYGELEKQVIQPLQAVARGGKSGINLLRVAHERGIPWRSCGHGVYQFGWGQHAVRMKGSRIMTDSAIGAQTAQNKHLAAEWLRTAGFPAPEHHLVGTESEALAAAARLGWPLVVKPVDRDRSEGVTVGIHDDDALKAAFRAAVALSPQVLVEREIPGTCHRIAVLRGKVLYAVDRLPQSVCGDGVQTVRALVDAARAGESCKPAWARSKPFPADAIAEETLASAGLGWTSVPAAGQLVPLRTFGSTTLGGTSIDRTTAMHPDNADLAVRAAALFGLDVAGIDLITPDISRPWHENGAVINEVNASPMLGTTPVTYAYLPRAFDWLTEANGRIPITAVVGGAEAWEAARALQAEWCAAGHACFLASHEHCLQPDGSPLHLAGAPGLFDRCLALLADRRVGALVMAVQTDEFLHRGFPVDRIDRLEETGGELLTRTPETVAALSRELHRLLAAAPPAGG